MAKATPPQADVPLNSSLRTHHKRGLPPALFSSTTPHGHISGNPRPPQMQRAFETRKATIMRTMTATQIEAAYQEKVNEILQVVEEDRRKNEEIDREAELLSKQREMERRVFWKVREEKDKQRKGREQS